MLCYSSESNPPYFWDNLILFHTIPNSGQKQDKVGQNIFNYVLSIVAIVESILSDITIQLLLYPTLKGFDRNHSSQLKVNSGGIYWQYLLRKTNVLRAMKHHSNNAN